MLGRSEGGVTPPWRGKHAEFGWIQPDGDRQRFVLLADETSDREHRFDMDVPEGGQMVKNPDGSVDVLDADGNVVNHVKAPWAYDATGRPVETYYEVDNDTGEIVQHIDPDRTTVFPVLADPEETAQQQRKNDAEMASRQPGFIGPVTAEDRAGQERNKERQRQQANENLRVASNSNQDPAKVKPSAPAAQPQHQPVLAQQDSPRTPNASNLQPNGDVVMQYEDGAYDVHPGEDRQLVDNPGGSPATAPVGGGDVTTYEPLPDKNATTPQPVRSTLNDDQSASQTFQEPGGGQFTVDTAAPQQGQPQGYEVSRAGQTETTGTYAQDPVTGADQWEGTDHATGRAFSGSSRFRVL